MNDLDHINELEIFGKFLISNVRDAVVSESEALITGKSMSLNSYRLTEKLVDFKEEDIEAVRELVIKSVDNALSNLLYKLQYEQEQGSQVKIMVGQTDISKISEFLQGELHSDEGWIEKFSEYKSL